MIIYKISLLSASLLSEDSYLDLTIKSMSLIVYKYHANPSPNRILSLRKASELGAIRESINGERCEPHSVQPAYKDLAYLSCSKLRREKKIRPATRWKLEGTIRRIKVLGKAD